MPLENPDDNGRHSSEEFEVVRALMQRTDAEINGLDAMVRAYSGLPARQYASEAMEELLAEYEARLAITFLDGHTDVMPYDLRMSAIQAVPDSTLVAAAWPEFRQFDNGCSATDVREVYREERLPSVKPAGYTGILGVGQGLDSTYHDLFFSAHQTNMDPLDIVLDDDVFAGFVRRRIQPTTFVAHELQTIGSITPNTMLDEQERRLRQDFASETVLTSSDRRELEGDIAAYRNNMGNQLLAIQFSNALRHGHAQATRHRVAELWSEDALSLIHGPVLDQLQHIIHTTLPFPGDELPPQALEWLSQTDNLRPEDFA